MAALSSLSVNLLLGSNPNKKNCEDFEMHMENNSLLKSCKASVAATSIQLMPSVSSTASSICMNDTLAQIPISKSPLIEQEKQTYVSGWCLRKVFQSCLCEDCRTSLQRSEERDGNLFLHLKHIPKATELDGGLIMPASEVVSLVAALEIVFYSYIQTLYSSDCLLLKLKNLLRNKIDVGGYLQLHDPKHSVMVSEAFLDAYCRVRIHFWCQQICEDRQKESRCKRAAGQAKRGASSSVDAVLEAVVGNSTSHVKKLKKLNIM